MGPLKKISPSPVETEKPKIVAIMPAYNASRTLEQTFREIPADSVSECIVVDDFSADSTVEVARKLGLRVFLHRENQGYGGNQKTCYVEALKTGADIVVMLHPDYQYDPKKFPDLVRPIVEDRADLVLGSGWPTRSRAECRSTNDFPTASLPGAKTRSSAFASLTIPPRPHPTLVRR